MGPWLVWWIFHSISSNQRLLIKEWRGHFSPLVFLVRSVIPEWKPPCRFCWPCNRRQLVFPPRALFGISWRTAICPGWEDASMSPQTCRHRHRMRTPRAWSCPNRPPGSRYCRRPRCSRRGLCKTIVVVHHYPPLPDHVRSVCHKTLWVRPRYENWGEWLCHSGSVYAFTGLFLVQNPSIAESRAFRD